MGSREDMISTVTIQRLTTAEVAIEHPDEWNDADLQRAVVARVVDVTNRADLWAGDSSVKLTQIARGYDFRDEDENEDEGGDRPVAYRPDPVELSDEDLAPVEAPAVVTADEVADG